MTKHGLRSPVCGGHFEAQNSSQVGHRSEDRQTYGTEVYLHKMTTNGVKHTDTADYTSLQELLTDSLHDLRKIYARLTLPHIQKKLDTGLHDTEDLPNKELSTLSSQIVDVLYATDRLLQPSNLVLADHFLGTYVDHESDNLKYRFLIKNFCRIRRLAMSPCSCSAKGP